MTAFLYGKGSPSYFAYSIWSLHASQAQRCTSLFCKVAEHFQNTWSTPTPLPPPPPQPVTPLTFSLVRTPVSSTFQNTLFLMPLQMHTTFMPSKIVRGSGGMSDNGFIAASEDKAGSGEGSVSGCEVESHPGPSKPSFVGLSPAKPLVF